MNYRKINKRSNNTVAKTLKDTISTKVAIKRIVSIPNTDDIFDALKNIRPRTNSGKSALSAREAFEQHYVRV